LNGLVNQESGSLSDLLSNLLGCGHTTVTLDVSDASMYPRMEWELTLNGMSELWAEGDVSDRNIIEDQVESPGSLHQVLSNQSRYLIFTFGKLWHALGVWRAQVQRTISR
jgi:hypothetical protein